MLSRSCGCRSPSWYMLQQSTPPCRSPILRARWSTSWERATATDCGEKIQRQSFYQTLPQYNSMSEKSWKEICISNRKRKLAFAEHHGVGNNKSWYRQNGSSGNSCTAFWKPVLLLRKWNLVSKHNSARLLQAFYRFSQDRCCTFCIILLNWKTFGFPTFP